MKKNNISPTIIIFSLILVGLLSGCLNQPISNGPEPTQPPSTSPHPIEILEITNVKAQATLDSATITWKTNLDSDSLVRYGSSSGKYSDSGGSRQYSRDHEIEITGLKPNRTYYYRAGSVTANGLASQSQENTFSTSFKPPSTIKNIAIDVGTTSVSLTWETDQITQANLSYGSTPEDISNTITLPQQGLEHAIAISQLIPGVTYYYKITVMDEYGITTESDIAYFTTRPLQENESIIIGNLSLSMGVLDDFYITDQFLTKLPIEIKNLATSMRGLSYKGSAALGKDGLQYNSLESSGSLKDVSILPGATINRNLYFERLPPGEGIIYLNLEDSQGQHYNLQIKVNAPEHKEAPITSTPPPSSNGDNIPPTVTNETKNSLKINIDRITPRFEELSGSRSNLYVKIDITLTNEGEKPLSTKFTPKPGIVDDKGIQHIYVKNSIPDTDLFPGGTLSGSIYFSPYLDIHTKEFTLFLYINEVKNEFILKVF